MNMRGAFLHVLSDALGSVIVVISATIIIVFDEWKYRDYMDPALSIILVILILYSVWPLLRESALILLQTVPTHIQVRWYIHWLDGIRLLTDSLLLFFVLRMQVDAIQKRLLERVDGVLAVHEFHVWQLAGDRIIASAHIRCRNLSEYMRIAEKVKEFFHNEGIHSTTIQPEFLEIETLYNTTGEYAKNECECATLLTVFLFPLTSLWCIQMVFQHIWMWMECKMVVRLTVQPPMKDALKPLAAKQITRYFKHKLTKECAVV